MKTFSALALDLDGSLLESDDKLSAESISLLEEARDRGVAVALFSGRMYCSALNFWNQFHPGTPIVAYNGAYIRDPRLGHDEGLIRHEPVSLADARAMLAFCEGEGIHVNAYVDDTLYVPEDGGIGRWYADFYDVPLRAVGPLSRWVSTPSTKLLAIAPTPADLPSMRRKIAAAAEGRNIRLTQSSDHYIEMLDPSVNKGEALRFLARHLDIPVAEWAALGDAGNDIEMIATAGLGIAVTGSPAAQHPHDAEVPQGATGIRQILDAHFGLCAF